MTVRSRKVNGIQCAGENRRRQTVKSKRQIAKPIFNRAVHWQQYNPACRDITSNRAKIASAAPGTIKFSDSLRAKTRKISQRATADVVAEPVAARCERNCAESDSAT